MASRRKSTGKTKELHRVPDAWRMIDVHFSSDVERELEDVEEVTEKRRVALLQEAELDDPNGQWQTLERETVKASAALRDVRVYVDKGRAYERAIWEGESKYKPPVLAAC